ncbi:MAG: hydrogenase, partial [Acidobacteriota bacterium]|nr:hydrogenase [Acidobacteriota bacterium]
MKDEQKNQKPLFPKMIEGEHTFATLTDKISDKTLKKRTPFGWFVGFGIGFIMLQLLMFTVAYLVFTGIGIWGNNQPVGWAFDIINFVWWIGIGHAGTLISAILLL